MGRPHMALTVMYLGVVGLNSVPELYCPTVTTPPSGSWASMVQLAGVEFKAMQKALLIAATPSHWLVVSPVSSRRLASTWRLNDAE